MCIDYPTSIVILYKLIIHMLNVDFKLVRRRRQFTYINPALSILQRKQDRSTLAQCFLNVGPALQTMDQC